MFPLEKFQYYYGGKTPLQLVCDYIRRNPNLTFAEVLDHKDILKGIEYSDIQQRFLINKSFLANWIRIAPLIAFVRAHRGHALQYSILPVLHQIQQYAGVEIGVPKFKCLQPVMTAAATVVKSSVKTVSTVTIPDSEKTATPSTAIATVKTGSTIVSTTTAATETLASSSTSAAASNSARFNSAANALIVAAATNVHGRQSIPLSTAAVAPIPFLPSGGPHTSTATGTGSMGTYSLLQPNLGSIATNNGSSSAAAAATATHHNPFTKNASV